MSTKTDTIEIKVASAPPFDPLDMSNYSLAKLPELKVTGILFKMRQIGVPLALLAFLTFHFKWFGTIESFQTQTLLEPQACYSALGIFLASLILWMSEAIPNYLTSFICIVAVILTGIMPMRRTFAYLGEPVMILNIASFIMASALVATGVAKRLALKIVIRFFHKVDYILLAFIGINLVLGAFISATSAKTALLLPIFMVISSVFGATGGEYRNAVGKNMVLQNLAANNISASAFMTGAAANLLAAQFMQNTGAQLYYSDWFIAMFPFSVMQCVFAWWSGTRIIFPISKEDAIPKLEGGKQRLQYEIDKLGPMSFDEIKAIIVFCLVLLFWATDRFHGIQAQVIAMIGSIIVLMPGFSGLPRLGVISWNDVDIPWHMLMFSWGAYAIGGMIDETNIVGIGMDNLFNFLNITMDTPKVVVFMILSGLFGLMAIVNQSKTARVVIMFPILIATAQRFGWDIVGFCLPMTVFISTVYCLYFNSKPANISYLLNQYSTAENFKFGFIQMVFAWVMLIPYTQYIMPLMGFNSQLW